METQDNEYTKDSNNNETKNKEPEELQEECTELKNI